MKKKRLFTLIGSTLLPILAAFACAILFSYEHNDQLLFIFAGFSLLLANLSLFLHALEMKKYGPFAFCFFSSGLLLTGKFLFESNWHETVGIFGLFFSSILNLFLSSED